VPDESVGLVAELAFSESGNARFGIELLWRAGKYADADNLDTVIPECVRKAASSIIPAVRKNELSILNLHEKLFLLAIARLFKQNQKSTISLAEAEKAYAVVCEEVGATPNSHTQLWKYLKDFSKRGITDTEVSGTGSRGRSTGISLPRVPANELEKELGMLLDKEFKET
jgi:cell division control protein 6